MPAEFVACSGSMIWSIRILVLRGASCPLGCKVLLGGAGYLQRTVSKQLLAQSDLNRQLDKILMAAVAATLSRAALAGTGCVQPLGLINNPLIPLVSHGATGGAPTLTTFDSHVTKVIQASAPMLAPGWAVSPLTRSKAVKTPIFSNTSIPLAISVNSQDSIIGFPSIATTLLSDANVKSSGTGLGSAIFGDWSQIGVFLWPTISISTDPYGVNARNGNVDLWMDTHADVVCVQPSCFARSDDILTT
jgi:HK97 family phage major capsid protein